MSSMREEKKVGRNKEVVLKSKTYFKRTGYFEQNCLYSIAESSLLNTITFLVLKKLTFVPARFCKVYKNKLRDSYF